MAYSMFPEYILTKADYTLRLLPQEYQENESALVVDDTTFSQTINLYGCKNCTVQIKGKVNAVTLGENIITRSTWHLTEGPF